MYIDIYYWFTIIVFFLWIILFITATFIPVQFDSNGNVIQNNSYIMRDKIFTLGFICMGIFLMLIFILFLTIYFIIPTNTADVVNLIKFGFAKN